MGEWFNFASMGMDGVGIKSDRQLIRDIHESSRLFSLQKPDHLTLDQASIQYLKDHHPSLYTQRRIQAYKLMHPALKPSNPFELEPVDHLQQQQKIDQFSNIFGQQTQETSIINDMPLINEYQKRLIQRKKQEEQNQLEKLIEIINNKNINKQRNNNKELKKKIRAALKKKDCEMMNKTEAMAINKKIEQENVNGFQTKSTLIDKKIDHSFKEELSYEKTLEEYQNIIKGQKSSQNIFNFENASEQQSILQDQTSKKNILQILIQSEAKLSNLQLKISRSQQDKQNNQINQSNKNLANEKLSKINFKLKKINNLQIENNSQDQKKANQNFDFKKSSKIRLQTIRQNHLEKSIEQKLKKSQSGQIKSSQLVFKPKQIQNNLTDIESSPLNIVYSQGVLSPSYLKKAAQIIVGHSPIINIDPNQVSSFLSNSQTKPKFDFIISLNKISQSSLNLFSSRTQNTEMKDQIKDTKIIQESQVKLTNFRARSRSRNNNLQQIQTNNDILSSQIFENKLTNNINRIPIKLTILNNSKPQKTLNNNLNAESENIIDLITNNVTQEDSYSFKQAEHNEDFHKKQNIYNATDKSLNQDQQYQLQLSQTMILNYDGQQNERCESSAKYRETMNESQDSKIQGQGFQIESHLQKPLYHLNHLDN